MSKRRIAIRLGLSAPLLFISLCSAGAQETRRITTAYDAFGASTTLEKDWGFAALVEYGGRRILFDTGSDANILERNARRLGLDLTHLDAVVISHRHGDHTGGLSHLLEVNPTIKIYTPQEGAFFERGELPVGFLEPEPSLSPEMRYFGGAPSHERPTAARSFIWDADFDTIRETTEIFPGIFLFTTRSEKTFTVEMNEVSLALRTPKGLAVVVGCSHPGVEKILEQAATIDPQLYTVVGGFHLVLTPPEEVRRTADVLIDELKVERVAPGHCTSELGFAVFMDRFEERFDRAGLGSVITLP